MITLAGGVVFYYCVSKMGPKIKDYNTRLILISVERWVQSTPKVIVDLGTFPLCIWKMIRST